MKEAFHIIISDPVPKVNAAAIGAVGLSGAELWVRIASAAVPAIVATAYTIWKWRKESKK